MRRCSWGPILNSRMIGTNLTHYHLTSKLGEGGMGEVYQATDVRLGREVAIKVLSASVSGDPQNLVRFEREARALAALNHPCIAAIHGIEADRGLSFLVLELVEGETLAERLRRGPLRIEETLAIGGQIAEALHEAHEKGIIHRDLKPGNVKITPRGRVKVLDFGLAKMMTTPETRTVAETSLLLSAQANHSTVQEDATMPGKVIGTPAYMSPEQARGQALDQRTDVWAFGCCLYECLCGRKAFHGPTISDLMAEVLKGEPDWSRIPSETPREIEAAIKGCLVKDPACRTSSLGEVASLLRDASHGRSVPASRLVSMTQTPQVATATRYAIAVLPFVNVSSDPENDYFSDGITEDLISALSRVEGLRVPARTSSFVFKNKRDDIRRIGQELGVSMVLEGTVRRSGTRFRITAQLIGVADGFHLWSERYDCELKDVFEVQDEVVGRVVSALKVKLGVTERERMAKKATYNPEAYDLYLLGRHLWTRRQVEDLPQVLEKFQQALQKDPGYALAYSGLADYYLNRGYFFGNLSCAEAAPLARDNAQKAIALDPKLGEAHVSLGLVKLLLDWDFTGAESALKKAIEFNPHYPVAYHFRALQLWGLHRRLDDALAVLQQGLSIDPLSVPIRNMRAIILSQAGHNEEAIAETHKILELDPHNVWEYLGRAYENCGQPDRAISWYLRWLEEEGVAPDVIKRLRAVSEVEGLAGLHRLQSQLLVDGQEWLPLAPHWRKAYLVQAYARLGRFDDAFLVLEQALRDRMPLVVWLKVDSRFDLLRDDPRFTALMRKVGIPD